MTGFTHQTGHLFQVDDAEIYVELAGSPTGAPLVLLHGGLGNMMDFNAILAHLPEQFRLIRIDFRGHGKSTLGNAPLTYHQYQTDVETVLDRLGITHYSVIGFSDGGITALRLAAAQPSRIRALITIGAHHQLASDDPVLGMYAAMTANRWRALFPDNVARYEATNPEPDFDRLVPAVVALWTEAAAYPGEAVHHITAPTLMVRGDQDHLCTRPHILALGELLPQADWFNLPGIGHDVLNEAPALCMAGIAPFLVQHCQ
ncbi:alpha/beta fold hydrolase [Photobacterium atrarenae]|uniref:Alpha/beta hydrolase n=1 Tax=Photobacterium atrarenae TaxID=865757 RepID=A0ABY5GP87_9GAMM|nr:alpha/beta hydrolase [Photobacterium atrarenae]UTV30610.1 alpha/beta hydrolase [Photobacterium atrarenae]